MGDRVRLALAAADRFPGRDYDLVACFDSLYDVGGPGRRRRPRARGARPDSTSLLVEPRSSDRVDDSLNPVGFVALGVPAGGDAA